MFHLTTLTGGLKRLVLTQSLSTAWEESTKDTATSRHDGRSRLQILTDFLFSETISEKNDCVYYVAVKGVSSSAFTILATVPSLPVPLPLSQMLKVTLPPGGIQQYFTPLVMLKVLTSLQA
eukprot:symbB.v1.2.018834.t1/scaffold1519.1/size114092/6